VPKFFIKTYGCQMNERDSEQVAHSLIERGYERAERESDADKGPRRAHEGLKAAIRRVFAASWQRCRVHWMRNALSYVAKTQQSMVAAALRQASFSRTAPRPAKHCATWLISCGRNGQSSLRSSMTARPMFCRISTSPSSTAPSCTAQTRWNG